MRVASLGGLSIASNTSAVAPASSATDKLAVRAGVTSDPDSFLNTANGVAGSGVEMADLEKEIAAVSGKQAAKAGPVVVPSSR
jgi:hypothetical protein